MARARRPFGSTQEHDHEITVGFSELLAEYREKRKVSLLNWMAWHGLLALLFFAAAGFCLQVALGVWP